MICSNQEVRAPAHRRALCGRPAPSTRRMHACIGRSRASNSTRADGRNSTCQVTGRHRDRPVTSIPRSCATSSIGMPGGRPAASHSAIASAAARDQYSSSRLQRLQILDRHYGGDRFSIANEHHPLLVVFGAPPLRRTVQRPLLWQRKQMDGWHRRANIGSLCGKDAAWIAVGTSITERPPHRTVRAAFPHTAPTSGV
jgi:hypothetical protein